MQLDVQTDTQKERWQTYTQAIDFLLTFVLSPLTGELSIIIDSLDEVELLLLALGVFLVDSNTLRKFSSRSIISKLPLFTLLKHFFPSLEQCTKLFNIVRCKLAMSSALTTTSESQ
jgi:hypothetical protein